MAAIRVLACLMLVLSCRSEWLANALEGDNVAREKGHDRVVAATNNTVGGRKMNVHNLKLVLKETSKITKAKLVVVVGHGKEMMNGTGSVEEDGFVASNEDYHSPQHHPPKHN